MKRFFYALGAMAASLALFYGCAKNSDLENLTARVDKIETDKIEALNSAVASINDVIVSLQEYIAVLENENSDLEDEITELKTYVDSLNAATKDWVSDTYVTMDVYNSLSTKVSQMWDTLTALVDKLKATDSKLAEHTELIEELDNNLDELNRTVAELKATVWEIWNRIQSLIYIPRYSDCSAVMTYTENGTTITPGEAELDFKVQPMAVAEQHANAWNQGQRLIQMLAVYTITKAQTEEVELTITSVTSPDYGILRVGVSGEGLKEAFFRGNISANASLRILHSSAVAYSDYILLSPRKKTALTFSDAAFNSFCKANLDVDGDGSFTDQDAAFVTEIDCSSATGIASLDGLKYFTSLRTLDVSGTAITSLDVTANPLLDTLKMENVASLTSLTCPRGVKVKTNFAVGRQLNVNGSGGVVWSVSSDGFTTKLVSLDKKSKITWADAKTWCESKGVFWILPSNNELKLIKKNKDAISSALSAAGGSTFMTNSSYDEYWSSETYTTTNSYGNTLTMVKCTSFNPDIADSAFTFNIQAKYAPSVRAICIF